MFSLFKRLCNNKNTCLSILLFPTASRGFYLAVATGLASFSTCIFWEAGKTSTASALCMRFNVISASTAVTLEPKCSVFFILLLSHMLNTNTDISPDTLLGICSTRQLVTLGTRITRACIAPEFMTGVWLK